MNWKCGTSALFGLLLICLAAGCSDRTSQTDLRPAEPSQPFTRDQGEIPWFDGTVEQAFAAAADQDKPVFLYWGAEWCPPCHELKATIFRREEFIAQSQLFVPVYLDGDTQRAQVYGESFGVLGYPTVIVFDPAGAEITRIPGGMDIQRYVSVLELALNALRPVSQLLAAVERDETLRDEDWQLLASYAWDQDRGRVLGERELYAVLSMLARHCPENLEIAKSRLQLAAIGQWLSDEERDQVLAATYKAEVAAVLARQSLWRANLNSWIYGGGDMVVSLAEGSEQRALQAQIAGLLEALIEDEDLDLLTRIEAIFGWYEVQRATLPEEGALTDAQIAWTREQIETARESLNSYQQHAALNVIAQLYFEMGLHEEARLAAEEGVRVSKQPYYFMSLLAYMEREAGNDDAALDWYRQAWESSRGPATRGQWGTNYLVALVELRPEALVLIEQTGEAVLGELAAQQDGLHHRNSARMDRLSGRLLLWAGAVPEDPPGTEDRREVLAQFRVSMDRLCDGEIAAGDAANTCATFLVEPNQA